MEPTSALLIGAAIVGSVWAWLSKKSEGDVVGPDSIPDLPPMIPGTTDLDGDFDELDPFEPTETTFSPTNPTTVPNHSGHLAGYNANLYPNFKAIRRDFRRIGYNVSDVEAPLPAGATLAFQKHFNAAVEEGFFNVYGNLDEDDVPGKNTLNALEWITYGLDGYQSDDDIRWFAWADEYGLG